MLRPAPSWPRQPACLSRSAASRNWDYRYVWVRDAAFTIALLRLGFTSEADAFMQFIFKHATTFEAGASGPMQIMYGIDGRAGLPERELPPPLGHFGSRPVRIGNGTDRPASARHLQRAHGLGLPLRRLVPAHLERPLKTITTRADWLSDHWDQPDSIWETRGGPGSSCTHSSCAGWRWSGRSGWPTARPARQPGTLAARSRRDLPAAGPRLVIRAPGVRPIRRCRGPGRIRLLMPLVKFISPTDPRWLSTLGNADRQPGV